MKSTIEKKTNLLLLSKLFDQLNAVCSSVVVEKFFFFFIFFLVLSFFLFFLSFFELLNLKFRAYDKAIATLREKEKKPTNSFLAEYLGLSQHSSPSLSIGGGQVEGSTSALLRSSSTGNLQSSNEDRKNSRSTLKRFPSQDPSQETYCFFL